MIEIAAYDAAGNVTYDGRNQYLYDAEGRLSTPRTRTCPRGPRLCAVASTPIPGMTTLTGYLYDADGARVAKGAISAWSCDPAVNGFVPTTDYVLGLGGEQAAEMTVSVSAGGSTSVPTERWAHTNVWAAGALIATYDNTGTGLHFYFNDPLGTRRAQTDSAGILEQTCQSLPYGDGLACSGSITSPTEHHFTGKERDSESGNDYFGARYYASSMGRFMSPDFTGADDGPPEAVPYSDLSDPQSLNLYAYVQNNPLARFDSDGHDCVNGSNAANGTVSYISTSNPGDCGKGFTYVNGTVDPNSFTYSNGQLGFNISNYADGSGMAASVTMTVGNQADPDTLSAGVFGPASASTWNNSAGVVNGAFKAEETAFGFVFPLTFLAVDALAGSSPTGAQAAGISRKPGTLGMRKGTDALRREDKVVRDIAKKLNLSKDEANAAHELLQEGSQQAGRAMGYREALEYVAKALGKAL